MGGQTLTWVPACGAIETREALKGLVDSGGHGVQKTRVVPGLAHLAACPVPTTGDGQARPSSPPTPTCLLLSPQWHCGLPGRAWGADGMWVPATWVSKRAPSP